MKKIKTINKILSSLTLLSPLSGVGFNSQYQNTQKVITENNNTLNTYFNLNANQRTMGDVTVEVEGTIITKFVSLSGEGKLIVDSDITQISNSVFEDQSNISSVDLSNATSLTTIGDNAFNSSSKSTGPFYSLTIPSNVTTIGNNAFNNSNVGSIDLSNATSLTTIGSQAFKSCSNLTGDLVIPSKVTSIGNQAFEYTNITSLDLSQATSLTTIGDAAFRYCENIIGKLNIPKNLQTIGDECFKDTSISSLTIDKSNQYFSLATNLGPDAQVLVSGSEKTWNNNSKAIGSLAWGQIILPNNITFIAENAFQSTNITSLDLSQATSLTTIGDNAFMSCSNLTGDLVIPSSVTNIGNYTFYNVEIKNIIFYSETPPKVGNYSLPTIQDKVYVPSLEAKKTYNRELGYHFFQIDIGIPKDNENNSYNIPVIIAILIGLGIPLILAFGFIIWSLTKKKKTIVKI